MQKIESLACFLAFDIKNRHPLIVEKMAQEILNLKIKYEEFLLILGCKSPLSAINMYPHGRSYLDFKDGNFTFKSYYETSKKRKAHYLISLLLYVIFAEAGLYVFLESIVEIEKHPPTFYVYIVGMIIGASLFYIGTIFFKHIKGIISAHKLLTETRKTQPT